MMHDEYKDLLLLIIVIFFIILSTVIIVGYNMKPNRYHVHTLISETFNK